MCNTKKQILATLSFYDTLLFLSYKFAWHFFYFCFFTWRSMRNILSVQHWSATVAWAESQITFIHTHIVGILFPFFSSWFFPRLCFVFYVPHLFSFTNLPRTSPLPSFSWALLALPRDIVVEDISFFFLLVPSFFFFYHKNKNFTRAFVSTRRTICVGVLLVPNNRLDIVSCTL